MMMLRLVVLLVVFVVLVVVVEVMNVRMRYNQIDLVNDDHDSEFAAPLISAAQYAPSALYNMGSNHHPPKYSWGEAFKNYIPRRLRVAAT